MLILSRSDLIDLANQYEEVKNSLEIAQKWIEDN
jgi:hypothetical protein